jgi:hypothetical protein
MTRYIMPSPHISVGPLRMQVNLLHKMARWLDTQ